MLLFICRKNAGPGDTMLSLLRDANIDLDKMKEESKKLPEEDGNVCVSPLFSHSMDAISFSFLFNRLVSFATTTIVGRGRLVRLVKLVRLPTMLPLDW